MSTATIQTVGSHKQRDWPKHMDRESFIEI